VLSFRAKWGNLMAQAGQPSHRVRFGEFRFDFQTAELQNNGQKLVLQDQPFLVLTVLLESPGRLVTREELKKRLWPPDTFVDFDHGINKAVNRLRETRTTQQIIPDSSRHCPGAVIAS
jgi:DNA-binding response OmpR family regulator